MSKTAEELEAAWNESSQEAGFHDQGRMTPVKWTNAAEKFYSLFFKKTGLHDSLVRGLFIDWQRLSYDEAQAIKRKHKVKSGFCAYLAEYLEKKVASAGSSTAYTFEEGELNGEIH